MASHEFFSRFQRLPLDLVLIAWLINSLIDDCIQSTQPFSLLFGRYVPPPNWITASHFESPTGRRQQTQDAIDYRPSRSRCQLTSHATAADLPSPNVSCCSIIPHRRGYGGYKHGSESMTVSGRLCIVELLAATRHPSYVSPAHCRVRPHSAPHCVSRLSYSQTTRTVAMLLRLAATQRDLTLHNETLPLTRSDNAADA